MLRKKNSVETELTIIDNISIFHFAEIPVEEPPEQWEEVQLSAVELTIGTQNYPPDLTVSL